ncbi:MAG TPA: hypothetical protein PLZ51_24045, partial [Aggregatilineales bacterium]|nr:hypothetical protein [Aggregatilineales bacterium]
MKKYIVIIVATLCFAPICVVGINIYWLFQLMHNLQPQNEALATIYDEEVSAIIENFELVYGSFEVKTNPSNLLDIVTQAYSEKIEAYQPVDTVYVTDHILIKEIRVLDYSPSRIKAIGCGFIEASEQTLDGHPIRTFSRRFFQKIYVFEYENMIWKLATAYDFTDNDGGIRDWAYIS